MYRKNTSDWMKYENFILLDALLLQIAFVVSYMVRNGVGNPYSSELYRNSAVFLFMFGLCIGVFSGCYNGILQRGYWKELLETFKYSILITIGELAYLFILQNSQEFSRIVLIVFLVFSTFLLYTGHIVMKGVLYKNRRSMEDKRSIVFVCSQDNYKMVAEHFLSNPYSEFYIAAIGIIDSDEIGMVPYKGIPLLDAEQDILKFVQVNWVDEVMFCLPKSMKMPDELVDRCSIMGVTVHFWLMTNWDPEYENQCIENIEGYTVLTRNIKMATTSQLFIKRTLDIAGGIVGVILTGILTVFIAPAIFICSPGPIFFKQVRIGKNGRRFNIYKFRSMYMDAEERKKELLDSNNVKDGMMFKMEDDPRIIKGIGHFIRKYSIDEFPQFLNVLKGDMSLVGTRPPTVDEWEKYDYHHRTRLAIKPGITGMWQVSGRSEITDFEEVVKLDEKYIRNWNLGLDAKIILQTIGVIFRKKGAF